MIFLLHGHPNLQRWKLIIMPQFIITSIGLKSLEKVPVELGNHFMAMTRSIRQWIIEVIAVTEENILKFNQTFLQKGFDGCRVISDTKQSDENMSWTRASVFFYPVGLRGRRRWRGKLLLPFPLLLQMLLKQDV